VQAQVLEPDAQHRAGGLGGVAVAGVGGVEDVADLALAVLLAAPEQGHVAHQLARVAQDGGEVERVALLRQHCALLLLRKHAAQLVAVAHVEVQVAHHVRIAVDRHQRVEILGRERAEVQPLGGDWVVGSQHRGDASQ
jgi:hypothetical protein